MGIATFLQLFALHGKSAARDSAAPCWKLTLVCAQPALTSLRKSVQLELRSRGLSASRMVSMPIYKNDQACLELVLNGSAQGKKACGELAMSISQLPGVEKIHWGRATIMLH
ncbi:hypothetical protein BI347_15945 [Chromobacterium sphagni]|uniref:Uncharacterized protein n=2 Tax=Chromobacterium sphagni TaxID=1903179 RepID=A0A1S1WVN4_9NEIS|nr:hypothetical protein BI347_15945 [Chromobacterium sphagni]